jgi:hypothetical protein
MSREIVREHGVMLLLGSMRAEERLAAFLLNLVQRLHARGFSQSELVLRMTREEIGSYLGLKLETVSRTFSKFVEDGIVEVKQRHVHILDTEALKRIVNNQQPCQQGADPQQQSPCFGQPSGRPSDGNGQRLTSNGDIASSVVSALDAMVMIQNAKKPRV